MPAGLTARTLKVWLPGLTVLSKGERQGLKGFLSSLHWNAWPAWSETKVNLARRREVFRAGFFFSVVFGAGAATWIWLEPWLFSWLPSPW
jgi:hypothetical protein